MCIWRRETACSTLQRPVPAPPLRISSDCSSVTVVADLHLPKPPLQYDQASFKVNISFHLLFSF